MSYIIEPDTEFTFSNIEAVSAGVGTVFEQCALVTQGEDQSLLIQCIADVLQKGSNARVADARAWYSVITASLVFFMQAGFAMLCAGCVRKKNVQNTMLKNLLDAVGTAISYFAVGFAFSFGGDDRSGDITFLGNQNFFSMGEINFPFWFFQYAVASTCITIIAGTLAERCQMVAYLFYSVFLSGFVYPVVAHAMWSTNGLYSPSRPDPFRGVGAIDFAGSGVVHLTGGTTAIIATTILGARKGRFHDKKGRLLSKPRVMPGHSIALQLMGTMVLWFGWYGFNPGSSLMLKVPDTGRVAGRAAVNMSLAAASGALSSLFTNMIIQERQTGIIAFDLSRAMNGTLGALVSVTSGCGTIENWAACITGFIAGLLYLGGSKLLVRLHLDDAVDAIPVHFVNGMWGMIATGLFASPSGMQEAYLRQEHVGWFYSLGKGTLDATLLGNQLLAVITIMCWVTVCMAPFFLFLNYLGWFRADTLEEMVGLDVFAGGDRRKLVGDAAKRGDIHDIYEDDDDDEDIKSPPQRGGKVIPDNASDTSSEEDDHEDKIAIEAAKFYDEDQSDAS